MKNIHVAFCFDVNYMKYMLVAARSIISNNFESCITFHLVYSDLSESNKEFIRKTLEEDCKVFFYDGKGLNIDIKSSNNRYGLAALYRLFLAQLLPNNIKKVIYLDCDLIVNSDLHELWEYNLEASYLAAVVNLCGKACVEVNLKPSEYFNSGVLLINLDLWRKTEFSQEILKFMIAHENKLKYLDQSAMNKILEKKWIKLPLMWNVQSDTYAYLHKPNSFYSTEEVIFALQNTKIIHFTGPRKPWHYYSFHPCKNFYKIQYSKVFDLPDSNFYIDKNFFSFIKKNLEFKRNLKMIVNRKWCN